MSSTVQPLYKLLILEMLSEVDFPLTNSQITECLITCQYATYFEIQQTFAELLASALVEEETVHHATQYRITEEGEQTLLYYKHQIPGRFLDTIHQYLTEHKFELRSKVSVLTGYTPTQNGEFAVHCQIMEKNAALFQMTLTAPTDELAEKMCFNFERKQAKLYAHIMDELIEEGTAQ